MARGYAAAVTTGGGWWWVVSGGYGAKMLEWVLMLVRILEGHCWEVGRFGILCCGNLLLFTRSGV